MKITFNFDAGSKERVWKEVEAHLPEPDNWGRGQADVARLPDSLSYLGELGVKQLNSSYSNWHWSVGKESHCDPNLVYGGGSIPTHTDEVSGLTLLILLHLKESPSGASLTDDNLFGELYTPIEMVALKPFEGAVFNDCEPHSWLSNCSWAFAAFPVIRFPK